MVNSNVCYSQAGRIVMLAKKLIFAALVLFAVQFCCSSKYEIILEKIEAALGADDKVMDFQTLRMKKLNKTTYGVNGTYAIKMAIDDSFSVSLTLLNFQAGQFKKLGDKTVAGVCKMIYENETFREYFENYQRHQLHPVEWGTCPYPSGENSVKNYVLDDFGKFLPQYIPGTDKWKVEVRWISPSGEILGGHNAYMILRTQETLLNGYG